mgnify:FL=1
MKDSHIHLGYVGLIVMVLLGTSINKDEAIQEQRELCYQAIESGKILKEHYKNE